MTNLVRNDLQVKNEVLYHIKHKFEYDLTKQI